MLTYLFKAATNDPRKVIVLSLAMEVDGRSDVVLDLTTPEAIEKTKNSPITIKEGVDYRMKVRFKYVSVLPFQCMSDSLGCNMM
jgi:hypothetical protein